MRAAEDRFVALEVESAEQRVMVHSLEQSIGDLRAEMNRRFDAMDARFDALGKEMSVQFRWLMGLLFSALLAVVLALARG